MASRKVEIRCEVSWEKLSGYVVVEVRLRLTEVSRTLTRKKTPEAVDRAKAGAKKAKVHRPLITDSRYFEHSPD